MDNDNLPEPETVVNYDATNIAKLGSLLRNHLLAIKLKTEPGSLRKIGREINISHTYLSEFRDGKAISLNIMNRLANHFGYRYYIENYVEDGNDMGLNHTKN
ncbi:MAG: hypothetical protein V3T17_17505 [Pseudomonadales bacterium]